MNQINHSPSFSFDLIFPFFPSHEHLEQKYSSTNIAQIQTNQTKSGKTSSIFLCWCRGGICWQFSGISSAVGGESAGKTNKSEKWQSFAICSIFLQFSLKVSSSIASNCAELKTLDQICCKYFDDWKYFCCARSYLGKWWLGRICCEVCNCWIRWKFLKLVQTVGVLLIVVLLLKGEKVIYAVYSKFRQFLAA